MEAPTTKKLFGLFSVKHLRTLVFLLHLFSVAILFSSQTTFTTPDTPRYIALSESISDGRFGLETSRGFEPESLRLPGYPAFLLVLRTVFGDSDYSIVIPQMILYLLSVWFTAKAVEWSFSPDASLIFVAISLFFPVVAIDALYVIPHLTTLFFLSAAVFAISKPEWRSSPWAFVVSGAMLAFASYQRTNILPLALILTFVAIVYLKEQRRLAAVMAGVLVLLMLPWGVRNFATFGSYLPSSTNVGLETMIYQNSMEARYAAETGVYFRRNAFPKTYEEYKSVAIQEQLKTMKRALGFEESDDYHRIVFDLPPNKVAPAKEMLLANAWVNLKAAPVRFVSIGVATFLRMWIGKADLPVSTFFYPPGILGMAIGGLVFVFAVLGLPFLFFSEDENARFLGYICIAVFLFFSVSLALLHSEVRYANPGKLLYIAMAAFVISKLWRFRYPNPG